MDPIFSSSSNLDFMDHSSSSVERSICGKTSSAFSAYRLLATSKPSATASIARLACFASPMTVNSIPALSQASLQCTAVPGDGSHSQNYTVTGHSPFSSGVSTTTPVSLISRHKALVIIPRLHRQASASRQSSGACLNLPPLSPFISSTFTACPLPPAHLRFQDPPNRLRSRIHLPSGSISCSRTALA